MKKASAFVYQALFYRSYLVLCNQMYSDWPCVLRSWLPWSVRGDPQAVTETWSNTLTSEHQICGWLLCVGATVKTPVGTYSPDFPSAQPSCYCHLFLTAQLSASPCFSLAPAAIPHMHRRSPTASNVRRVSKGGRTRWNVSVWLLSLPLSWIGWVIPD